MTWLPPIPPRVYWRCGAEFSPDGLHRYTLWRHWGEQPPLVVLSLNPSTADASQDDPTIRRDIDFAHRWGCGGLIKLNLFSYRSTDPRELLKASDPVGPGNDAAIELTVARVPRVVLAWGSHRTPAALGRLVRERAQHVEALVRHACTGEIGTFGHRSAYGAPAHPLYLPKTTPFVPCEWTVRT